MPGASMSFVSREYQSNDAVSELLKNPRSMPTSVVMTRSQVSDERTSDGIDAPFRAVPAELIQFTFLLPSVMVEINWLAARFSLPRWP